MPEFVCRVATADRRRLRARATSPTDESALRRDLENQDLMILDVRRRNPLLQQTAPDASGSRARSPSREFLIFNQELSALVRAGLPILPSLDILLERRKNPAFRQRAAWTSATGSSRASRSPRRSRRRASCSRRSTRPAWPRASARARWPRVLQRFIDYPQKVLGDPAQGHLGADLPGDPARCCRSV